MPDDETVEQLQEMLELLDRYPQIRDSAAEEIIAWAEKRMLYDGDTAFNRATRKEQAGIFINWLKAMIGHEHG